MAVGEEFEDSPAAADPEAMRDAEKAEAHVESTTARILTTNSVISTKDVFNPTITNDALRNIYTQTAESREKAALAKLVVAQPAIKNAQEQLQAVLTADIQDSFRGQVEKVIDGFNDMELTKEEYSNEKFLLALRDGTHLLDSMKELHAEPDSPTGILTARLENYLAAYYEPTKQYTLASVMPGYQPTEDSRSKENVRVVLKLVGVSVFGVLTGISAFSKSVPFTMAYGGLTYLCYNGFNLGTDKVDNLVQETKFLADGSGFEDFMRQFNMADNRKPLKKLAQAVFDKDDDLLNTKATDEELKTAMQRIAKADGEPLSPEMLALTQDPDKAKAFIGYMKRFKTEEGQNFAMEYLTHTKNGGGRALLAELDEARMASAS
ncbi:MAG: hypothetical protein JWM56_1344 [Candidatus Peribacteria bacterium]|nr:hypothetical protein [Candidatus Peribacteria bacterium]